MKCICGCGKEAVKTINGKPACEEMAHMYANNIKFAERVYGMGFNYNFPATRSVNENTVEDQLGCAINATREMFAACDVSFDYDADDPLAVKVEGCNQGVFDKAMNLYYLLETLFRMGEKSGININELRLTAIQKYRERGYYEEGAK